MIGLNEVLHKPKSPLAWPCYSNDEDDEHDRDDDDEDDDHCDKNYEDAGLSVLGRTQLISHGLGLGLLHGLLHGLGHSH